MAEAAKLTMQLSALIYAILAVMGDFLLFAMVIGGWVVCFSMSLYWLAVGADAGRGEDRSAALVHDLQFEGLHSAGTADLIYYVIMSLLGLTGIDAILNGSWIMRAAYAACALSTVVVILNLLMSSMVSTYEVLQRSFQELAIKSRAELVVSAECRRTQASRAKLYDSFYFEDRIDFEDGDDGPSGGVQMTFHVEQLDHPSFKLLDRIERYKGRSRAGDPWDPEEMISSGTYVHASSRESTRNAATAKALKGLASDIGTAAAEVFVIKRAMRLDDDASTLAGSEYASEATSVVGLMPSESSAVSDRRLVLGLARDDPCDSVSSMYPVDRPSNSEEGGASAHADAQPRPVSASELLGHGTESSLWIAVDGVVRDCTELLDRHPGGRAVLVSAAGGDASDVFHSAHLGASYNVARQGLMRCPTVGILQGSVNL
mmetsp:Transcript_11522/g.27354  ORF Transcript_11522/g.27354 Transcript_11522/m.27354 type:complete len:431 (+) Transcript_11522:3-1295(+)